MAQGAPTQPLPALGTACPTCGAHAEPGQLVCLECGTRLALDYRRPRGWKTAAAVIAVVLLVAGAAFAVTLVAVDNNSKHQVAATKPGEGAGKRAHKRRAARKSAPSRTYVAGLPGWPRGRNGYTVVLLSAGDLASGTAFARRVQSSGLHVGVLRSREYSSLTPGYWVVFSGFYKTRARARRAAVRLSGRFQGAFAQYVNGAKSR